MNKIAVSLLLFLFPGLVLADSSLSFAPPASDFSVVFLSNLFGVVDGVLSGTGSQIMGSIFGVLNAAVLAIGGIVILYTLIVATMNTAHEGQMLGQKWSSIWIPIRSTIGLALLIPKASGYCLMQIFVMWVVVQGVGAADKVWDAALSYLNRGGVIIQAQQQSPTAQLTQNPGSGVSGIGIGATNILAGQVCMLGLQTQLQNTRQNYLQQQSRKTGPCQNATPGSTMATFCSTVVPDFLSSFNAITVQNGNPTLSSWSVDMPNFATPPYNFLNGICGTITWSSIASNPAFSNLPTKVVAGANTQVGNVTLNPSEVATTQMSRAIAIQQMYTNLSTVARSIISNDPQMSTTNNNPNNQPIPPWANTQFGVPYQESGIPCPNTAAGCVIWGPTQGSTGGGVLFTGIELINAINAYNGIMMPTLNLARVITKSNNQQSATSFINKATTQGWIMAGAYFYNLVQIQGASSIENSNLVDANSGLEKSSFDSTTITSPFKRGSTKQATCDSGNRPGKDFTNLCCDSGNRPGKDFTNLCIWFDQDDTAVTQVQALINSPSSTISTPPKPSASMTLISGVASSTVYGFINNSLMMQTPGQPGTKPLTFANKGIPSVEPQLTYLPWINFSCGEVKPFFSMCMGRIIGDFVYNIVVRSIYNVLMLAVGPLIQAVVKAFLMIPLQGMAEIFRQGLNIIAAPGVNPVVALANMGNAYINFAGNLWMYLMFLAVSSALIPVFGVFIFALLTLGMPLVIAWIGIMVSIGFITAYYIPILPYIIFVFAALGWMIAVIEAMVAAPIVALGVTHPEGHDAFGKGEAAIMLLLNIFLRPTMMIIGYIAAIALSYVGVWLLNAGYDQAIAFVTDIQKNDQSNLLAGNTVWQQISGQGPYGPSAYSDWSGIYAFFFSILSYTVVYLTIIQKSFTLITYLPDKILRWIGGTPESIGQESAQWGEEVKGKVGEAGKETQQAQGQMEKTMGAYGMKAGGKVSEKIFGKAGGSGGALAEGQEAFNKSSSAESTPSSPKDKDTGSSGPPPGAGPVAK